MTNINKILIFSFYLVRFEYSRTPSLADPLVMEMLESLAFAGSKLPLRLFSEAMGRICQDASNRYILLTNEKGQNIFKRLLWCVGFDDK